MYRGDIHSLVMESVRSAMTYRDRYRMSEGSNVAAVDVGKYILEVNTDSAGRTIRVRRCKNNNIGDIYGRPRTELKIILDGNQRYAYSLFLSLTHRCRK